MTALATPISGRPSRGVPAANRHDKSTGLTMAEFAGMVSGWHPTAVPWRTGKTVGRTIYACPPGSSYRQGEVLIGMMDTPELARAAVDAYNARIDGSQVSENLRDESRTDAR